MVYTTNMWTKLPRPLKAQVAFLKMEVLSYNYDCHESCMLKLSFYQDAIADYMADNPGALHEQISQYLNASEDRVTLLMKKYLVDMAKEVEELKKKRDPSYKMKLPEYLRDYLKDADGDMEVKSRIMARFDQQVGASSWVLDGLLSTIEDKSKSVDDRIPAIWDLSSIAYESKDDKTPRYENINYDRICDLFMNIAQDKEESGQVRYAVLSRMYACTGFPENYTREMFEKIKNIFEDEDEPLGIRDAALTELKMYEEVSASTTKEYMDKVYNNEDEHEFLRFGAWAFFKERGNEDYKEIEIDGEVFDNYLDETGDVWYVRKNY